MNRCYAYIKYLLRAKDQHSLHSPFVYTLYTKCIYRKKYSQTKDYYHRINTFLIETAGEEIFKGHYCNSLSFNFFSILKQKNEEHKGIQWFFINRIYENQQTHKLWNKLTRDKNISISLDFWSFGLIFTKKNQEKENFILFKNPWR